MTKSAPPSDRKPPRQRFVPVQRKQMPDTPKPPPPALATDLHQHSLSAPPPLPKFTPAPQAQRGPNQTGMSAEPAPLRAETGPQAPLPEAQVARPQISKPPVSESGKPPKPKAALPPLPELDHNFPGLVAKGLQKSFGKRKVLHDVNIGIRPGEVVGLLGPNGAGKTTSFYIVCGLIQADLGYIGIDGRNVSGMPMYRRARYGLGYLPQEASIFRGLTVAQNILAALEVVEPKRAKRKQRLNALLEEFSITHLRDTNALALSGGERRRTEIARALASNPQYVLLDEPFAGVDPIAVGDIRSLVGQLKNQGIGVLITDHNVRDTLQVVDRAYIIYDGAVLMHGTPEEVVVDQRVRQVYLGEDFSM